MRSGTTAIRGRFIAGGREEALHGLEVRLDITRGGEARVGGVGHLDRDGGFRIDAQVASEDGASHLELVLLDAADGIISRNRVPIPEKGRDRVGIEIEIAPEAWRDRPRVGSLPRLAQGWQPSRQLHFARVAAGRLAPDSAWVSSLFDCLGPVAERFTGLLADARAVLDGDPTAPRRMREMLVKRSRPESRPPEIAPSTSSVKSRVAAADHPDGIGGPGGEALLLLGLAAGVALGEGGHDFEEHHLGRVSGWAGTLIAFDELRRAAAGALGGGDRARHHFLGMLGGMRDLCDPERPWPERTLPDPDRWREPFQCIPRGIELLTEGGPTWNIAAVTPEDACPGAAITITGSGFGDGSSLSGLIASRVRFSAAPLHHPPGYVEVEAQTWSDDSITVVVPEHATAGPLSLRIRGQTVRFCGYAHDLCRRGTPYDFGGPSWRKVEWFHLNGQPGDVVVAPGSTGIFDWSVAPPTGVTLYRLLENGWSTDLQNGPSAGSLEVEFPNTALTDERTYVLAVPSQCGPVTEHKRVVIHRPCRVFLTGMEITQGTQSFRAAEHMGDDAPAIAPDNAVPLVALKKTLVRVYVGCDQDPDFNVGRSGGARVRLHGYRGTTPLPGSPLTPVDDPVAADSDLSVANQRGSPTRSANFRLPQTWTGEDGATRLVARLSMAEGALDTVDSERNRVELTGLAFREALPLDCVLVLLDYTGPLVEDEDSASGANGAPSEADAVLTISRVRRIFPTARMSIALPQPQDRVIAVSQILTQRNFFGGTGWGDALNQLQGIALWYDDDAERVWCAVARSDIPIFIDDEDSGGFIAGSGSGSRPFALGYAAFRSDANGAPDTEAAHEIGHALDGHHADEDPAWSAEAGSGYDDPFSIGEFGVDVEGFFDADAPATTSAIKAPSARRDYMHSEGGAWTSPYTWRALQQRRFDPAAPSGDVAQSVSGGLLQREGRRRREYLVIRGGIDPATGAVALQPLWHMPRRPPGSRSSARDTGFRLALIDHRGRTLLTRPVLAPRECGSNDDPASGAPLLIAEALPWHPETAALEIRLGDDEVLARAERPKGTPEITDLALRPGGDSWYLTWKARHPDALPLHASVWFTPDDGKRWVAIGRDLETSALDIDPRTLSSGATSRLRVYISDGFNTAFADTPAFDLPPAVPQLLVIAPLQAKVAAGRPLDLEAMTLAPWPSPAPGIIRWSSDLQGDLGTGHRLTTTLKSGPHRLTAELVIAGETLASRSIEVTAS